MTESFSLQSVHSGNRLTFEAVGNAASRGERFVIQLTADGLNAQSAIYDGGYAAPHLAALLKALAADWRGWQGQRTWESLEGDLRLRFSWDKTGHVPVEVELANDAGVPDWRVEAPIVLEVGMLEGLAASAERFFS